MSRPSEDRIAGVLLIGLGVLTLLWGRCVWLQWLGASRYATLALKQQRVTQTLPSRRGTIMDRHGRTLAMNVDAPSVFANARRIEDKRGISVQLAHLVTRDARMIEQRLARDKDFVWVARHVDPTLTSLLVELHGAGIGIVEEPTRAYPHAHMASHLVGFVNIDQRGLEGLELSLNGVLRGQPGLRTTLRDAKGAPLIGPWTAYTPPLDGHDVVLTIDSVVQEVAEEALT